MELSHLTNKSGERSQDKAELPNGKSACKEEVEIMCTNLQKLGWRKPEKYSYREEFLSKRINISPKYLKKNFSFLYLNVQNYKMKELDRILSHFSTLDGKKC